jgi:hypothetical protein
MKMYLGISHGEIFQDTDTIWLTSSRSRKVRISSAVNTRTGVRQAADNADMEIPIHLNLFSGQRPGLFNHPPIPVTVLSGNEFGENLNKTQLAQAADTLLRSIQRGEGLPNEDTGWLLKVNKKGRDKMGDNADMSVAESKVIAGIENLSRHAVAAEQHSDYEHQNPDVIAVFRLYAPVSIDGVLYRAKLTVKDYKDSGNTKTLHALAAVEIEDAPLGTLPSYSSDESLQTAQPTTGRMITVAELLKNATLYDGTEFKP